MEDEFLTVRQLNSQIDRILKRNPTLRNVKVRGEISNFKTVRGNSYFTLKDEDSQIKVTLYYNYQKFVEFKPEDGMTVIIKGSIAGYVKNGEYRLYAHRMTEDGIGDLNRKFEQLKLKLKNEGLFDESHKKEIPKFPKKIGVITSQTGAVIRDIITTINRRYPLCEILVFSTLVQGDNAAPQIVQKIKYAQNFNLDTLIVGRGGGSIEDLWAFNEEIVAREIYACETPVISAVGHEIDFTITDFVADKRAATPTAAAEIAVPDKKEIEYKINQLSNRINKQIINQLNQNKTRLNHISRKQIIQNPESIYQIKNMTLDNLISKIDFISKNILTENKAKLITLENSPVFKRPKSIYETEEMKLNKLMNKLQYTSKNIVSQNKNKLNRLENSPILKNPKNLYQNKEMKLDNLINKLQYTSKNIVSQNKNKLFILESNPILKNPEKITQPKKESYLRNIEKLEILNPLLTLKRGYAIAKSSDKVISSSKDVKTGDELDIEFNDGTINTKVI
ncbi:MAG: exodeoxyribonuclease VII large subunit [Methanobrevibacter sp.]|uniref:exodeoxyribonuclease VII large subunit n=1 Tax=Methanobrevibacter sp. TaxID=66852 RepID=UPI0025E5C8D8|nr:exodeoxyribonuclease VII large subunit [Methanobrevibacter sp.]MBE6509171.1 exodeoxyribonuclease VII large subunit [Methanobrevibacter sp.]